MDRFAILTKQMEQLEAKVFQLQLLIGALKYHLMELQTEHLPTEELDPE